MKLPFVDDWMVFHVGNFKEVSRYHLFERLRLNITNIAPIMSQIAQTGDWIGGRKAYS